MMKFNKSTPLKVAFIFGSTLVTFVSTLPNSVSAQCIQSHQGVQVNISRHGADQTNDVQFDNQGPCTGNSSSSTSTQLNIGGNGRNRQHQNSRHRQTGGQSNPTGINGPTVTNGTVVDVDVRTPKNFPY